MPQHLRWNLIASLALPFVLHAVLVLAAIALWEPRLSEMFWLGCGMIPVLAGYVFLERALRLYAAPLALVYFPAMFFAMFCLTLLIIALLYGETI